MRNQAGAHQVLRYGCECHGEVCDVLALYGNATAP